MGDRPAGDGPSGTAPRTGRPAGGLVPTLIVAGIVVFFAAGLPLLDTLLEPRESVVSAGSAASLTIGGEASGAFTPAAGWEQVDADDPAATALAHGGISFEVKVDQVPPGTTCTQGLDQAEATLQEIDETGRLLGSQTFATSPGQIGVQAPFVAARTEAIVFVVCSGDLIATATASGPVGALQGVPADADADAVAAMARSIELP